jgi:hypothetical protein
MLNMENTGSAIYFKIVRSLEILVDDPRHDDLIVFQSTLASQYIGIVLVAVNVPVIVLHIVVGPHDVKLHFSLFGFQETIVKGAFQKRAPSYQYQS